MPVGVDVKQGMIKAGIAAVNGVYPVKAPGITFDPPNDQKYVELVLITNNNRNEGWGNQELFSGFLRVILHWPIDGQGIYPPNQALELIKAEFPKGRVIYHGESSLLIYDVPAITDAIEEKTDILYPLTVPYQFFHVPA